jgi:hypothetical protein
MPWLTVINGFDPRVQLTGAVRGRSNGYLRPQVPGRRRLRWQRRRTAARPPELAEMAPPATKSLEEGIYV